mmetsp:Transcript_40259/g.84186  ORF Transcript_40259/g.84186 Transcript_40259/m.84186 type:complete len:319 (+) Transcript_40259:552-1508(+)
MAPMACFPMAHWYVLRGDWLWCGFGISPAHAPSTVRGSISRWVDLAVQRPSLSAIMESFSSFTSRYSMRPSFTKSVKVRHLSRTCWMCSWVTRGWPPITMMSGRHTRPPSQEMLTLACFSLVWIDTYSPRRPARRMARMSMTKRRGERWTPSTKPLRKTRYMLPCDTSSPQRRLMSCTPRLYASRCIGSSASSVVTCVISAKFFTRPHASPSGVSAGQSIPHCDGCSDRGPDTLRVFSNCDCTRVIIPRAAMKDSRDSTWVTPWRSMPKRRRFQLPVEMELTSPVVILVAGRYLSTSKVLVRDGFSSCFCATFCISAL